MLYLFLANSICGFNSGIVFKDLDDDDIIYVEDFIHTKLQSLIDVHLLNAEVYHPDQHSSCFFGEYSSEPANFTFTVSEKWLIKQIVDHVSKIIESGEDGGLSHFQYSPFESKLDSAVKSIPFFCNEPSETRLKLPEPSNKLYAKPILLNKLISQADKNDSRNKNGHRFDGDVMDLASHLRMICGKLGYESLQSNLPAALPSISSTNRHIREADGYVAEGVLRVEELKTYLESRNLPQIVSLSEDATRITGRIQYDSQSNEIIGFVLPSDKVTGMPIPHSYKARNAEEIIYHFSNRNAIANFVNVIMAQPLADAAPFCLMVHGSDSKYSAEDVINRYF